MHAENIHSITYTIRHGETAFEARRWMKALISEQPWALGSRISTQHSLSLPNVITNQSRSPTEPYQPELAADLHTASISIQLHTTATTWILWPLGAEQPHMYMVLNSTIPLTKALLTRRVCYA